MFVSCNSCGKPVAADSKYCPACGQRFPARVDGPKSALGPTRADAAWRASFDAGLDAITQKDFQTALARLGKAIVEAPESELAVCHATRGYAYLEIQQYERALSDCNEAIRLNPNDAEALAWRGSAFAGLSRWREAIEDFRLATELLPEEIEYEQVALSHTENAIADFRQRVKRGDSSCQLFHDRGVIYAFRGEWEKAIRDFTQAIEDDEFHAASYLERAKCLQHAAECDQALADCSRAIDLGCTETDVFRLRSNLAESAGDMQLALADLNVLLQRRPNDDDALRRRAQIRTRKRQFAQAHRDYSRLLHLTGVNSDAFVARGIVRCELGDYWGAIADFSRSLEDVPADAETLSLRGEARLAIQRTKAALEDFDAALELNTTCTAARRGRALVFSAGGKRKQALAQLERTLRLDPCYGLGFAAKGRVYQESDQLDAAIEAYDRALEIIGDGRGAADVYYRRAVCRATHDDWQQVGADLDAAIQRRPQHAGSRLWRANLRFRRGDWNAAIDDLMQASQVNPHDLPHYRKLAESACGIAIDQITRSICDGGVVGRPPDNAGPPHNGRPTSNPHCDRGMLRYFLGQFSLALEDFSSAIETDPRNLMARTHRAKIFHQLGDCVKASKEYAAAIDLDASNADLRRERARCQLQLGNGRQALDEINAAIGLAPDVADVYLERAKILARHGKVKAALSDLERAISLAPQGAEAYLERARLRAAAGQHAQAIQDLNSAIERDPRSHDASLMRAELLSRAGANDRALVDFETAIKLDGQSIQGHCGRALALARLDRHDVALRELTKVFRLFDQGGLAALLSCRAKIAYNAGQFRGAQGDFEAAAAAAAGDDPRRVAQAIYGRGLALHQLDEPDAAKQAMRDAIEIDPSCQAAVDAHGWLEGQQPERPGPLTRSLARNKIDAPLVVRGRLRDLETDARWDVDPPWNLWLVSGHDSDAEFGPVEKSVLDDWCRQGRIDENTLVLRTDWDQWRWATEIYPQLGGQARAAPTDKSDAKAELEGSSDRVSYPEIRV